MDPLTSLIPPHGGYRNLKSFQVARLVYDITIRFCDSYIEKRSRTHDQMVQAARSGVQNIAEGSEVSATSKKMEMKLTQVARASLEELKLDYEDYLRHRNLPQWERTDPRRVTLIERRPITTTDIGAWAKDVRAGHCGRGGHNGQESTSSTMSTTTPTTPTYPEISANAALALLAVACALLDRQVAPQAKAFEEEGGFTERLYRQRTSIRSKRQ
jgi:four helix bundle suffix protein